MLEYLLEGSLLLLVVVGSLFAILDEGDFMEFAPLWYTFETELHEIDLVNSIESLDPRLCRLFLLSGLRPWTARS